MEWLSRLRDALLEGRLFLDAQLISPAVAHSVAEGERLRYEVLVRLRDEQGEVVPPGLFLPVAERFGSAPDIDRWVIEEVFSQLTAHPEHLSRLEACYINLSGRSFDQPVFLDFMLTALDWHRELSTIIYFDITDNASFKY